MSTLSEMTDRLKELVDSGATHNPKLHEGLNHCEGCERLDIVLKLRDYLRFEQDTKPQDQLGGLSRAETELPKIESLWADSKAAAIERLQRK